MTVSILCGDCRDLLRALPDESAHCVVTSPPYWGLRDYGIAGQMGLETSLGEHVAGMIKVFREVRRVLRKDGTLWLNYGDSYASGEIGRHDALAAANGNAGITYKSLGEAQNGSRQQARLRTGLKPKDLCGIPWRVAFALQEDGWWLRQDIIWSKPNSMPESVTDRCTKAHEYLFLLAKSERYYFDQEAIRESDAGHASGNGFAGRQGTADYRPQLGSNGVDGNRRTGGEGTRESWLPGKGRNKRSVWEVTTQPFSEAHFATFPCALIEPCIKAGCPVGGVVLDPFAGAGTTGLVADRLQRNAVLIELNPQYAEMAECRLRSDAPLFVDIAPQRSAYVAGAREAG